MEQRGPRLKDVVLRIVCSLVLIFIIALMSRFTGINLIQLVIGFVILIFSYELMLNPQKVKGLLQKIIKSIVNKKVQSLVKELAEEKLKLS